MKKILLLVIFSLFLNCNKTEVLKNDLTRQKLKGEIKSFVESEYTVSDKFGKITKDNLFYEYKSQLNSKGNLLEENIYVEDDPLRDNKIIFKYDNNNALVEKIYYKENFVYDDLGNVIQLVGFGSDGSLRGKVLSKFNADSNLLEENVYLSDGNLYSKRNCKYNEKKYLFEENVYNADGSLNFRSTYKYDEKGNKIESKSYNADGSLNIQSFYKYNHNGDVVEENSSENGKNTNYIHKYVYDNKGNWLEVLTFKNEIPIKIGFRNYEYY